jgi:hypothetical protein
VRLRLLALAGQKLVQVRVNDPLPGRSAFTFDLGARLSTTPYGSLQKEQWHLYEPSGWVLSLGTDGRYQHHPGDTQPEAWEWLPLI